MLQNTSFGAQSIMIRKNYIQSLIIDGKTINASSIEEVITNEKDETVLIKLIGGKNILLDAIALVMSNIVDKTLVIFDREKEIVSISFK